MGGIINLIHKIISTVFFSGCVKYMPGTVGSAMTIILIPIIFLDNFIFSFCIFLSLFLVGWYSASQYSRKIMVLDPKEVVIDELVAQFMVWNVIYKINNIYFFSIYSIQYLFIIGFILFRFFDIYKPFPVDYFDKKFKNGFGIMFDDIIAGLYAIVVFCIITKFFVLIV